MDKIQLLEILKDWNLWGNPQLETGTARPDLLDKVEQLALSRQVLVVTGARRSGKSYLLRQLCQRLGIKTGSTKNVLYINFEDPRFLALNTSLLDHIVEIYRTEVVPDIKEITIILDEIQLVDGWERWVTSYHELKKGSLILSGSNANLLSSELATLLTGRHIDFTTYPLSWNEFREFTKKPANMQSFDEFLEFGGFPEVVLSNSKKEILLAYFNDILNRDLIQRYRVRKPEQLKSLALYFLSNPATLTTHRSIQKFLGLSINTVEKFSSHLESVFLVQHMKRFSAKAKEVERAPRKTYVIDTGLAQAIGHRIFENKSQGLENAVFIELKRQQARHPGLEIFYYHARDGGEVDFLIKEGSHIRALIQVTLDLSHPKTKQREVRSLQKAMLEFNHRDGLILTNSGIDEPEILFSGGKIQIISVQDWLTRSSLFLG